MRSMRLPVLLGAMLLLGAGPAMAAPIVTAKVPFPFTVRGQVLPAGEYRVERDNENGDVLIIKAVHGGHSAVIARSIDASGEDPLGDQAALLFTRDGNGYRLKDVWQDREGGRELPR